MDTTNTSTDSCIAHQIFMLRRILASRIRESQRSHGLGHGQRGWPKAGHLPPRKPRAGIYSKHKTAGQNNPIGPKNDHRLLGKHHIDVKVQEKPKI